MSNQQYWKDKELRAQIALKHTNEMDTIFQREIQISMIGTREFLQGFNIVDSESPLYPLPKIIIDNIDSVSAIYKYGTDPSVKTAVLNFASYKEPGGMFLQGSSAQEESLCHESFLYNVLRHYNSYYEWNKKNLNRALYFNRALYTPDICFTRHKDRIQKCDVITCAAPNKTTAQKYQNVTNRENHIVLKRRIKYVLDIAKEQGVRNLILGAYGCGVFGQDPNEVAQIFRDFLIPGYNYDEHWNYTNFDKIIFAIPSYSSYGNYEAFNRIFNNN